MVHMDMYILASTTNIPNKSSQHNFHAQNAAKAMMLSP